MKCPNCNNKLFVETDDHMFYDEYAREDVNGYCPNCGKNFKWTNYFKFDRFENFFEDKELTDDE